MKSIKYNFSINMIRIISNLLFPIVIFPYVSRILFPEGVGKVSLSISIVNYFLLFANLGIPIYGIRKIAKDKIVPNALSKSFSEIFIINLITTFITCLLFLLFLKSGLSPADTVLLKISGLNILFTVFGVEWFYQGMEEYTYITIRSVIVRAISVVLIFLFVKTQSDYTKYAGILVFSNIGAYMLNFIRTKKYICFIRKNINLHKHIKPILTIFCMTLATSIYTNLDSVMLGYQSNEYAIGIYTSSIKINHVIIGVITSFSSVALPRISNYIAKKLYLELNVLLNQLFTFLLFISLFSAVILFAIAPETIKFLSGDKFFAAIKTMRILLPIIIFIAFSNFLGIVILYSYGEEKKVLYSVIVGAIVNFSLNLILIPKFNQNGAAFATTLAEFCVLFIMILLGKKYLNFTIFSKDNLKFIMATTIMAIVLYLFSKIFIRSYIMSLFYKVTIGTISYFLSMVILKEFYTLKLLNKIFRLLIKK